MSRFTQAPRNGTGNTGLRCEGGLNTVRDATSISRKKVACPLLRTASFERSPAVFFRNIVRVQGLTTSTQAVTAAEQGLHAPVNMAQRKQLSQATVVLAKYKIFNELCLAYRRSKNSVYLRADDVRRELVIPKDVFADALESFINEGQMAVEVVESNGERYLRLSESARENCD
jgi:hypothetical protein